MKPSGRLAGLLAILGFAAAFLTPGESSDYLPYEAPRSGIGLTRDLELAQEIRTQLLRSRFVDAGKIEVSVLNGTATLTGEVGSWAERSAAEQNAREGGAKRVRNLLKVRGAAEYPFEAPR